ncbi:MAG: hypothetical protein FWD41_02650, partial [Actinomycetia bacterium]|nr:hypothetical protein [Actinomycetes bacterium]
MSTTHKRAGAIAALATTVMVGLPTVAAAAARGTVDYDNYSLSVIGALIFLLSAALVYFLIFKRKKMVVKPVVEEMIKTSEKDAERKA